MLLDYQKGHHLREEEQLQLDVKLLDRYIRHPPVIHGAGIIVKDVQDSIFVPQTMNIVIIVGFSNKRMKGARKGNEL